MSKSPEFRGFCDIAVIGRDILGLSLKGAGSLRCDSPRDSSIVGCEDPRLWSRYGAFGLLADDSEKHCRICPDSDWELGIISLPIMQLS